MAASRTGSPAPVSALENLRVVPPWPQYLRQIWDRRWFVWRVPSEELRAENSSTSLGSLWHLLNPLLFLAIYYVLFAVGLRAGQGIEHFTTYLSIGIFFFRYFEQSAQRGGRALIRNMPLVMSVRFPRLILPLTGVVGALLYLLLGLIPLFAISLIDGAFPRVSWLGVIPLLIMQTAFNLGVAAFFARACFHVHDVQNLIQHFFRVLFYGSGVFFPVTSFFSGKWVVLFTVNPFFAYISLYRWALLGIEPPSGTVWSAVGWTVVALVGGVWYFRSAELSYGRQEF